MEQENTEKFLANQYERLSSLISLMGLSIEPNSHFPSLQKYFWSEEVPSDVELIREEVKKLLGKKPPQPLYDDVCLMLIIILYIFTELKVHYKHRIGGLQKFVYLLKEAEQKGVTNLYDGKIIDYVQIKFKPNRKIERILKGKRSFKFIDDYSVNFFIENLVTKIKSDYEELISGKTDAREASADKEFIYRASYAFSILLDDENFQTEYTIPEFIVELYNIIGIFHDLNHKITDTDSLRKDINNWISFGENLVKGKK